MSDKKIKLWREKRINIHCLTSSGYEEEGCSFPKGFLMASEECMPHAIRITNMAKKKKKKETTAIFVNCEIQVMFLRPLFICITIHIF
jgi:hypothetical protein